MNGEQPRQTAQGLIVPALVVRGPVLFPGSMAPMTVGRPQSLAALNATDQSRQVAVIAQRDGSREDPDPANLHEVGCTGTVLRLARVGEAPSPFLAFVEGNNRVRVCEVVQTEPFLQVRVDVLEDLLPETEDAEYAALRRNVTDLFQEIVLASPALADDVLAVFATQRDASALCDFVAASLPSLGAEAKQGLLEALDVRVRMKRLMQELLKERESLRMRDKIREQVGKSLSEAQHKMLLQEQLKAIQEELGERDGSDNLQELRERLDRANLPEEARREADRELERLAVIPPASPENSIVRTYLEWLAALPWRRKEPEPIDVTRAREILDADHYDLDKIKDRILEHIAVISLKRSVKGPILCLVGPPGVGKTSIGQSIARAMNRPFVRISLGGMRDEAEIRGHRRTYIGAMPGQIIRSMRQAGASDPVFMLDEVDKVGADFRGDPASALLEVLDPEQNREFRDHYLDVAFDLSNVLFLATANQMDPVLPALRDRMEVLDLAGYSDEEKLEIAKRYLIPQQVEAHGLDMPGQIELTEDGIAAIIRRYTHEAGVRDLERKIGAVCRKQAARIAAGHTEALTVDTDVLGSLLGAPRYIAEEDIGRRTESPGSAVALAWTPYGGEVLFVEASRVPRDKGELTITGQVQKVMEESTRAALTWLRSHCQEYGIDPDDFRRYDVHIHVPAGAVPKDGPSAGIVMVTALASLFTQQPVRRMTALTGEVTLTGHILPVGGIKEKVLAARRSGVRTIVLPRQNQVDVDEDIPDSLREDLDIRFVETIDQALAIALTEEADEVSTTEDQAVPVRHAPETLHRGGR